MKHKGEITLWRVPVSGGGSGNSASLAVICFLFYSIHFHCAREITSTGRERRFQEADSFVRKVRGLCKRIVPREEPGLRDGKERTEAETGLWTGRRTETGLWTGRRTVTETGAGTGAGRKKNRELGYPPHDDAVYLRDGKGRTGAETGLRTGRRTVTETVAGTRAKKGTGPGAGMETGAGADKGMGTRTWT